MKDVNQKEIQSLKELEQLRLQVANLEKQLENERRLLEDHIMSCKQKEEKLKIEYTALYSILDALPAYVYLISPDYSISFANRKFRYVIGSPEGKRCYQLMGDCDKPCSICKTKQVFKTGKPITWEWRANNDRIYVVNSYPFSDINTGSPLALTLAIDITERKKQEEALRLSEERLIKTVNAAPVLIARQRLDNGRFENVNETFLKATGYTYKEVIGRTIKELNMHVDESHDEMIKQLVEEKGSIRNLTVHFRNKAGEIREGLLSSEIVNINGELQILNIINDITDMKRMELEMAKLDRLNLVAEMAAGIGHEIRNPMTTVRGLLQILRKRDTSCRQEQPHFDVMIDELDRANSIITEYLSLARKKPSNLRQQSLNEVIRSLYPLIDASALDKSKYVVLDLGDIPDLLLNGNEIRQLILNLAQNGLESMDNGKRLVISTYQENRDVILAVQDEGQGIKPEYLDKLGTPFFTTKDKGTGLGLATCYSIATRHNATYSVKTGINGTTFYIRFKTSIK